MQEASTSALRYRQSCILQVVTHVDKERNVCTPMSGGLTIRGHHNRIAVNGSVISSALSHISKGTL